MVHHYLPQRNNMKAYSPKGVRDLFKQAVKDENGDIETVLKNKHKYKELNELWNASFLALAINKWLNQKFYLYQADFPDIYFLNGEIGFSVEVMELYFFDQTFDMSLKELAKHIWDKKGKMSLPDCHLLVIVRIPDMVMDIVEFTKEFNCFKWLFERVWLNVYTNINDYQKWTFFEIFPRSQSYNPEQIYFDLINDKKYFY